MATFFNQVIYSINVVITTDIHGVEQSVFVGVLDADVATAVPWALFVCDGPDLVEGGGHGAPKSTVGDGVLADDDSASQTH